MTLRKPMMMKPVINSCKKLVCCVDGQLDPPSLITHLITVCRREPRSWREILYLSSPTLKPCAGVSPVPGERSSYLSLPGEPLDEFVLSSITPLRSTMYPNVFDVPPPRPPSPPPGYEDGGSPTEALSPLMKPKHYIMTGNITLLASPSSSGQQPQPADNEPQRMRDSMIIVGDPVNPSGFMLDVGYGGNRGRN